MFGVLRWCMCWEVRVFSVLARKCTAVGMEKGPEHGKTPTLNPWVEEFCVVICVVGVEPPLFPSWLSCRVLVELMYMWHFWVDPPWARRGIRAHKRRTSGSTRHFVSLVSRLVSQRVISARFPSHLRSRLHAVSRHIRAEADWHRLEERDDSGSWFLQCVDTLKRSYCAKGLAWSRTEGSHPPGSVVCFMDGLLSCSSAKFYFLSRLFFKEELHLNTRKASHPPCPGGIPRKNKHGCVFAVAPFDLCGPGGD